MNSQRPSSSQASARSSRLQAVRDAHAHCRQLQRVDRVGHVLDIARHGLAVAVGKEGGDPPLVHPRHRVDMQPGLALARRRIFVVPGAEREPPGMVAGAEDEDVALAEPDALRRLDRLELGAGHRLARLEPVDPAMARRVEQHAATDDAGGIGGDAAPVRAARGEQRRPACRCRAAPIADVVERIDMGVAVAMARHAEVAHAERQAALADGMSCSSDIRWTAGLGLSGPAALLIGIAIETVRPLRTRRRRRGHLVRRQVVERSALVVGPPAAPVLHRLEHGVEGGEGDGSGRRQGSRHRTVLPRERPMRRGASGPERDAPPGPDGSWSRAGYWAPAVAARMVSTLSLVTKIRPESPIAGSGFCSQ